MTDLCRARFTSCMLYNEHEDLFNFQNFLIKDKKCFSSEC